MNIKYYPEWVNGSDSDYVIMLRGLHGYCPQVKNLPFIDMCCIMKFKENLIFNAKWNEVMRMVELATITTRGQMTLPIAVRKKLNVGEGSKVVFMEENGRVVIENAGMVALREAQESMRGVAESLGIKDEQDVVDMIKEVRQKKRREK